MKTVQEVLRSINREYLLWEYVECASPKVHVLDKEEKIEKLTYGKIKENYKANFHKFLDWLCQAEPRPDEDGKIGIIFGYPAPDLDVYHDLVFVDELQRHGEKAFGYAYDMNDWVETLAYFVADTRYTHKNLCEIMAQVLCEMQVYGLTPEEVTEGRESVFAQLEESMENIPRPEEHQEGRHQDSYQIIAEIEADRKKTLANPGSLSEGERLKLQYIDSWNDYADYLRGREIRKIIEQLKCNGLWKKQDGRRS